MNDKLEIPPYKNHKFASPSLTPSNQYRDKLSIPQVSLPSHVQNHNQTMKSNGNSYMGHKYSKSFATTQNIHGRKVDNNSAQINLNLEAVGEDRVLTNKTQNTIQKSKTMISKKILDLAKQKNKKSQNISTMKSKLNQKNQKKAQNKFEFNFQTTKSGQQLKSKTNSTTIDYEGIQRPGTVFVPNTAKNGKISSLAKKNKSEGKKNPKQLLNQTTMIVSKDNKENLNQSNDRAFSQQNKRKPKSTYYRNDGLSLSSFSSNSGKNKNDSIAKQLSKNYFLDPQQLLRHLSPPRNDKKTSGMPNSQTSLSLGRGRNRSTTKSVQMGVSHLKSNHQRNNSHSTSRKYNTDLHSLRELQTKQEVPIKSKSGGGLLPKKTLDKIIKQNLKKNKTKQNQEATKKLLEQQKQQIRKAELTQRNQQVRLINASKVSKTERETHRRRSKSCIAQQFKHTNKVTQSSSSERKPRNNSLGKSIQISPKTIPLTTTNKVQKEKPKTFVDEIIQLTNEVAMELGHPRLSAQQKKLSVTANESALKELLQNQKPCNQKRKTAQIQKFIERKKREDEIRKSLERTIQVDKQKKIQKNLSKLDKFVKKHVRQKSQNNLEGKKSSIVPQKKKRNKISMDAKIDGLLIKQENTPLNLSLLIDDMNSTQIMKQTSTKSGKLRAVVSSAGTRAGTTGSGKAGGHKRKTSANSSSMIANHKRQITLQPGNDGQINLIPPSVSQNISHIRKNSKIPMKTSISSKDTTTFLQKKHPELQNNSVATPSLNTAKIVEEMKPHTSQTKQQTGQIRRVHELVALYRSKFKPSTSDASVMGTLHAAASVIQIHFRYMRQLREAAKGDEIESFINSELSQNLKNVTPEDRFEVAHPAPPKQIFEESKPTQNKVKQIETKALKREPIQQKQEAPQTKPTKFLEPKPLQIPELDLHRIRILENEERKQKEKATTNSEVTIQADQSSQRTVSTYRGIFSKLGLPLPRSARVKVEYDLIDKDPMICEQLKQIVKYKDQRGKVIIEEGRKDNLISERTFQKNVRRLERWVTSSYNKIDKGAIKSGKRTKKPEELIQEAADEKKRLEQILDLQSKSARSFSARQSGRTLSQRGHLMHLQQQKEQQTENEESHTERDPQPTKVVRPSLAEVLQESSKMSSKSKNQSSSLKVDEESPVNEPTKLEDIEIQINFGDQSKQSSENHVATEKSLNRQESYPFSAAKEQKFEIQPDKLNEDSEREFSGSASPAIVNPDNIQLTFEDSKKQNNRIQDIRDPGFFSRQLDENYQYQDNQDFSIDELLDQSHQSMSEGRKPNPFNKTNNMKDLLRQEQTMMADFSDQEVVSSEQSAQKEIVPHNDAIKFENQKQPTIQTQQQQSEPSEVNPVSPMSDKLPIQTGALSLSSTDSDMIKAIQQANQDILDGLQNNSPEQQKKNQNNELADNLTDLIFNKFMIELGHEIEIIVPRCEQQSMQRPRQSLKFFDKKGIKTDLFAIERYVDEILEEIKLNQSDFMKEVSKPLSKDQLETLYMMQNSEIGSYEHFQNNLPPVLSLDLYLKLEKRRKDSKMNPKDPQQPNGLFDFENVNDADLREDGVDRNFLAECQHIHNKVLFDCINDSLQQFRPHGKDGCPMDWSRTGRKLKPTEDFTLEEMLEITKHDLFRMAIMQAGTLPRREFVFSGHFDDDLFQEIREKKLATLLCREIVETETGWLQWEFEEAQTKIDLGDMVLESLVTETIQFLQKKQKSQAQQNFESLQEMIINS